MTKNEILELRQKLTQNDIDHYNRRMDEIENEISLLKKKKNILQQKIGKKQIYINQLENDKEHVIYQNSQQCSDYCPNHNSTALECMNCGRPEGAH